jgi:FdhE protein
MRDSLQRQDPEGVSESEAVQAFVVDAVLQPFAEAVARERDLGSQPLGFGLLRPRCPNCSRLPCLGILREEGQGAKRSLLCSLCHTEWDYRRVVCASCGEEAFERLPVYTADFFSHVCIEACDTCRRYLKTVDLTKNGGSGGR